MAAVDINTSPGGQFSMVHFFLCCCSAYTVECYVVKYCVCYFFLYICSSFYLTRQAGLEQILIYNDTVILLSDCGGFMSVVFGPYTV